MHKILHLKFLLLLAMMLVGVGNVKAQEEEPTRILSAEPLNSTISYGPQTGTIELSAQNFTFDEVNSAVFWYFFNESSLGYQDNKDICEWITLSLSEDKKTITYTVTGNTSSEPRTAYFKLEFIFWETDGLSHTYSDMITVTQNPSDKPVAITSPENIFLESNAEGIEGTLTTTIYNLPHKIW